METTRDRHYIFSSVEPSTRMSNPSSSLTLNPPDAVKRLRRQIHGMAKLRKISDLVSLNPVESNLQRLGRERTNNMERKHSASQLRGLYDYQSVSSALEPVISFGWAVVVWFSKK
jgi:hypothetical protein